MKSKLSYRAWMAILLGALASLVPLGLFLLRLLPHETAADKRAWLLWASLLLIAAVALLFALIWIVLKDIQQIQQQYRKAHREAFEEMTQQLRADYHRKQAQQQGSQNGAE